jgi:hypothetical protein
MGTMISCPLKLNGSCTGQARATDFYIDCSLSCKFSSLFQIIIAQPEKPVQPSNSTLEMLVIQCDRFP